MNLRIKEITTLTAFSVSFSTIIISMVPKLNLNNAGLFAGVSIGAGVIKVIVIVVGIDDSPVLVLFCWKRSANLKYNMKYILLLYL